MKFGLKIYWDMLTVLATKSIAGSVEVIKPIGERSNSRKVMASNFFKWSVKHGFAEQVSRGKYQVTAKGKKASKTMVRLREFLDEPSVE